MRLEYRRISTQDTGRSKVSSTPESAELAAAAEPLDSAAGSLAEPSDAADEACDADAKLNKRRLNLTVARFILTWLGFMVLILGVVLLTNLEWARPRVEESMSESFHRKVHVGRLSWTLGLNGLAIWTDRLSMLEPDGKPFILSGESELGIAVVPLMQKRLIIKHVEFHNPEVFATQIAPGVWNFSDLLVEGPEIRYLQVTGGRLHLRNRITDEQLAKNPLSSVFASTKWRSYDFQDVRVNLIFPRKNQLRQWPFYLSFKLPRQVDGKKYTSSFSLTVLANGTFDSWKKKKSTIEIRGEQLNPQDWRPFMQLPEGVSGLFGFKFKGKGIVDDVLAGDVTASVDDVAYVQSGETVFSAKNAECSSKLLLRKDSVQWEKLKLSFAGMAIDSNGELSSWSSGHPVYDAVVTADLKRLDDLHQTSLWKLWPGAGDRKEKPELSGAAKIEIKLASDGKAQTITTSLKADSIPLTNLMAGGSPAGAGFLSLFQIKPDAAIKGHINIEADQKVVLRGVEIPAQGSVVKIDGWLNAGKKEHDVTLKALGLSLDKFDTDDIDGTVHKSQSGSIMLSGKVDVNARLTGSSSENKTDVQAKLHNAVISAGQTTLAQGLDGEVLFNGKMLKFQKIEGTIANRNGTKGNINVSGWAQTTPGGKCDLDIWGHAVDISQLISFCRSARIPLPEQSVANLSGIARDIHIIVKGDQSRPQLTLSLTPEDIDYQLSSSVSGKPLKPLKISGGTITASATQFEVKDVPIASQSGKILLSALFSGSGNSMLLKNLHLRTGGIDLTELNTYLALFYGFGYSNAAPYMVMEFVNGQTLQEVLFDQGKQTLDRTLDIALQLCEALQCIHTQGVIHRDLKPNNIMLTQQGDRLLVKLIDFGLAGINNISSLSAQKLTEAGTTVGTAEFMSPEQCAGEDVDSRSDIYSLGCILYTCLTGAPPFASTDGLTIMRQHVHDPVPQIAGDDAGDSTWDRIQFILERCLAKRREDRYPDASALQQDLLQIRRKGAISVSPLKTIKTAAAREKRQSRTPLLVAATLTALVSIAAVAALSGSNPGHTSRDTETSTDVLAAARKASQERRTSDAASLFSQALELNERDHLLSTSQTDLTQIELVRALRDLKRFREAIPIAEECISSLIINSHLSVYRGGLANAYEHCISWTGQYERGISVLKRFKQATLGQRAEADPQIRLSLASLYANSNDWTKVKEELDAIPPDMVDSIWDHEIYFRLYSQLYARLKDRDKSEQYHLKHLRALESIGRFHRKEVPPAVVTDALMEKIMPPGSVVRAPEPD